MIDKILQARMALKSKLRNRETVLAGWTSFGHPGLTEMILRAGIEFMGIDLEHSTISQEESQRIIAACQAQGVVCLPRIASHNREMGSRLLDSGADGLIVPLVNSAREAREIARWMKFPPEGCRGFGVARAQGYGHDFDQYAKTWNNSGILIVQIESKEGVKEINEILAVEEIDGVMVGPYDISGSLGFPGQLDHPQVVAAGVAVAAACAKRGKSCGAHLVVANLDLMRQAFNKGYTFLVLASDLFVMSQWSKLMREDIQRLKS
jgi:2-keto-3-deoxy-L-rhamnonate aldolase RhmA